MCGPACDTALEALEGLLEATEEMVRKRFQGLFEAFDRDRTFRVGDDLAQILERECSWYIDRSTASPSRSPSVSRDRRRNKRFG